MSDQTLIPWCSFDVPNILLVILEFTRTPCSKNIIYEMFMKPTSFPLTLNSLVAAEDDKPRVYCLTGLNTFIFMSHRDYSPTTPSECSRFSISTTPLRDCCKL